MTGNQLARSAGRGLLYGTGLAAGAYAAYVGASWLRFGRARGSARHSGGDDQESLIGRFMPSFDIRERHRVRVAAPAEVTFAAACEVDLLRSPVIASIFKVREWVLSAQPDALQRPRGLLRWARSLGWEVLADTPGQEMVFGAATRPWDADVSFRSIPRDEFAAFDEPGYVKIVWTLRAQPGGDGASVARTETRAVATDPTARRKFRRYWSAFSPGILLIRRAALRAVKAEAERRAREGRMKSSDRFDLVSQGDLDPQC